MKKICLAFFAMLSLVVFSQEEPKNSKTNQVQWTSSRPDGHAPISVMGAHVHHKGEWMLAYQYSFMNMDNNYQSTDKISDNKVLEQYMSVPSEMQMQMHMVHIMYAPTDRLTLMAMLHYMSSEMTSLMQMKMMKMETSMKTEGFGDFSVAAIYQIFNQNHNSLLAQAGIIIPTGSIDEAGEMDMGSQAHPMHMGYAMQLGSGSYSANIGLTYLWQGQLFSAGSKASSIIRLNDNDADYRLGNQYGLDAWVAIKATDFLSFSLRSGLNYVDKIHGLDSRMMPTMAPAENAENAGGTFADYGLGANIYLSKGTFKGLRFGTEFSLPLYRDVNGIQMTEDYSLTVGVQYSI